MYNTLNMLFILLPFTYPKAISSWSIKSCKLPEKYILKIVQCWYWRNTVMLNKEDTFKRNLLKNSYSTNYNNSKHYLFHWSFCQLFGKQQGWRWRSWWLWEWRGTSTHSVDEGIGIWRKWNLIHEHKIKNI